jgi:flagellar basal body-associated protein FliL
MISSDSEENDERFSGSELEEPANEEGESVRVSVVELDEPADEESESVPEEEKLPEGELDEPGDEERELIPEEEKSKGIWGKYREKPRSSLFIAIGLCLLMGIGYLYLKGKIFNIIVDQKGKIPELDRLAIPKDQLLIFPSFVIPFRENKRFSYISLSIYFNLPNKELMREMIEKKGELRGIIYDILRQEINKLKEVPSLEELKGFIIRGVNTALSAGKVNEVYITKFLAV